MSRKILIAHTSYSLLKRLLVPAVLMYERKHANDDGLCYSSWLRRSVLERNSPKVIDTYKILKKHHFNHVKALGEIHDRACDARLIRFSMEYHDESENLLHMMFINKGYLYKALKILKSHNDGAKIVIDIAQSDLHDLGLSFMDLVQFLRKYA